MLRKNLPKALTAVLSPSRSANRAPLGSTVAVGTAVAIEGGVANVARMCGHPTPPFFWQHRSGYETKKRMGVLLNTDIEAPRLKGSESTLISPHFFFLFFGFAPPPPRGRGDSKRSTGHELIEHSTIQSASRVTLAPQTTKRQKNW